MACHYISIHNMNIIVVKAYHYGSAAVMMGMGAVRKPVVTLAFISNGIGSGGLSP
jgi:hypothetical protein